MRLVNLAFYSFFLLFPAFFGIGRSQLPVWPILLFFVSHNLRLKVITVFVFFAVFLFLIGSIFSQAIIVPSSFSNNLYYLKQFVLVLVAMLISRKLDLHLTRLALLVACAVSFIVGCLEVFNPGLCNSFVYVNSVRACSGIRVSAFYNEPSHIAFLFFAFFVYHDRLGVGNRLYVFLLFAGFLFFSFTFISLFSFVVIYKLFKRRSGAFVFVSIFLFYTAISVGYLLLRDGGFLPVQQSWDKRNLFFVNSFFDVDLLLIYPFFLGREFLYDGWFQVLSSENFEIAQLAAGDIIYSLSFLGGLFWALGPFAILYAIIKLMRLPSISGLSLGALLLGFPASLFVLVALFAVDRMAVLSSSNSS